MPARAVCVLAALASAAMLLAGGLTAHAGPYDAAVLADSPFLWYRFEDAPGSLTATDSAGANDGTYVGVTLGEPTAGPALGSAGLFQGAGDRIEVPALGSYSQHSVEAWVNIDGLAPGCCTSLYSTDAWNTTGAGSSLHFNLKSGRDVEHAVNAGGPPNINTPGGAVQNDKWYHIVATYDATAGGATRIYLNGQPAADAAHTSAADINLGVPGEVGAWNTGRNFLGHMDEFAFYDSVLSPERVLAHYQAAIPPPPPPPPSPYADLVNADSPLVYYRFEDAPGAAQAADASGSSRHGTVEGSVSLGSPGAAAIVGSAAGFANGSPDGSVAVPALGSALGEFTIESWIHPNSLATFDTVYNVDGWSGGWLHYQFISGQRLRVALNGGGPNDRDYGGPTDFPLGEWTHVATTYDSATGDATVYANGRPIGTQNFGGRPLINLAAGHIGAWNGTSREFDGLIDEFAVYDHVLAQDAIRSRALAVLAPAGPTPYSQMVEASNPVVYYRFEEVAGTTAFDSSGNLHDGSYNGDAAPGQPSASPALGNALGLDGDNDYVRLYPDAIATDNFTVETWINARDINNWDGILNREGWSTGYLHYQFRPDGRLEAAIHSNGSVIFSQPFNEDQWYHTALTYDRGTGNMQLFVDGSLRQEGTIGTGAQPVLAPFAVGAWSGGRFFDGRMDEFAIYDRALTRDEIRSHAMAVYLPPGPPSLYEQAVRADNPVVYYRFEEIGGTTAFDSSGNHHDGAYFGPTLGQKSYGVLGSAVAFDGSVEQYVRLFPDAIALDEFAIETWLKPEDINNWDVIVNREGWAPGYVHYQFFPDGRLEFSINGNGPGDQFFSFAFDEDEWYHLVLNYTKDGQFAELFVNGEFQQRVDYWSAQTGILSPFAIGAWNGQRFFDGLMDEFAIYDHMLSAQDVMHHYRVALPEPATLCLLGLGLAALVRRRRRRPGSQRP